MSALNQSIDNSTSLLGLHGTGECHAARARVSDLISSNLRNVDFTGACADNTNLAPPRPEIVWDANREVFDRCSCTPVTRNPLYDYFSHGVNKCLNLIAQSADNQSGNYRSVRADINYNTPVVLIYPLNPETHKRRSVDKRKKEKDNIEDEVKLVTKALENKIRHANETMGASNLADSYSSARQRLG
ncbi:hypothetical protein EVAR_95435_1 [Eumeta japonica]|uniref:Uncharacterized protein n=1 Tax=Eumeta variegata TaxID=151549 RepID=A0A4C1VIW0_EUMVA|nr:hypothetical protein EVAR_95435_1 [Eumeta japonica]